MPSRTYDYLIAPAVQAKRYWDARKEIAKLRDVNAQLEEIHYRRTMIVPDRKTMISRLKKGAVVAEVGVASGDFSEMILRLAGPRKLHLIDMWADYRKSHGVAGSDILRNMFFRNNASSSLDSVKHRFAAEIGEERVVLNQGISWNALEQFQDAYLDWIYIDAGHDFESVRRDLELARSKVKPDGVIAGHDYVRWGRHGVRYGVVEAVNSFCIEHHYELIMLTNDVRTNASWAISTIG